MAVLGWESRLSYPAVMGRGALAPLSPTSMDVLISDCFLTTLSPGLGWVGKSRWLLKSGALMEVRGSGLPHPTNNPGLSYPDRKPLLRVFCLCRKSPGHGFPSGEDSRP